MLLEVNACKPRHQGLTAVSASVFTVKTHVPYVYICPNSGEHLHAAPSCPGLTLRSVCTHYWQVVCCPVCILACPKCSSAQLSAALHDRFLFPPCAVIACRTCDSWLVLDSDGVHHFKTFRLILRMFDTMARSHVPAFACSCI